MRMEIIELSGRIGLTDWRQSVEIVSQSHRGPSLFAMMDCARKNKEPEAKRRVLCSSFLARCDISEAIYAARSAASSNPRLWEA